MRFKYNAGVFGIICLGSLAGTSPVSAYNMHAKGSIHEGITSLAEDCVKASSGVQPMTCDFSGLDAVSSWSLTKKYSDLQVGSRWSDDPTRFVLKSGFPNFMAQMIGGCERRISKIGNDRSRRAELGLLCNSHYGDLQFLHAMSSSSEETRDDTVARMTDWARLSYRVATGAVGPSAGYCEYFSPRNGDSSTKPNLVGPISTDLLAAGKPYCDDRDKKFLGIKVGTYPKWRVHTIFSMTCKNPFQSKRCSEAINSKGIKMATDGASGALLHLVQDSYSQSHAVRDEQSDGTEFAAKAVCKPIQKFHEYSEQTAAGVDHGAADKMPAIVCQDNSEIHDPITASANIIWYIKQGQSSTDKRTWENKMVEYLSAHVFGNLAGE